MLRQCMIGCRCASRTQARRKRKRTRRRQENAPPRRKRTPITVLWVANAWMMTMISPRTSGVTMTMTMRLATTRRALRSDRPQIKVRRSPTRDQHPEAPRRRMCFGSTGALLALAHVNDQPCPGQIAKQSKDEHCRGHSPSSALGFVGT